MPDLSTPVVVGQAGHAQLHTDERTEINSLRARVTTTEGYVAPVTSVASKTGAVTLAKGDVGLSNVDNTSDVNKPVSTAQAAALATKADLVNGSVPAAQLPSYVDDVVEFNTADSTGFPATGESGKIYVAVQATPSPTQWRWSGSGYQQMVSSPGSTDAVPEGSVNKYFTDARAQAANAAALATRLNMRGDYVDGGVYAVNDVVNSPGFGRWRCIQAHTASGPAPNIESAYWTILGGNSNAVVGTQPGDAADVSTVVPNTRKINGKQLNVDFSLAFGDVGALGAGYAGAVPGSRFTVLWISGQGWPATRPSSRTDIFFDWLDTTGESTDADIPAQIFDGDTISRITETGVTTVTYRSSSVIGPNQAVDYLTNPLQLPGPAGLAIGDDYVVAVLFGSLPASSSFVAPSGFSRLTPVAASGQDFGVFHYPILTSSDLSAVATSNWSPNAASATRGQAIGVALQGVASVGTPTAISYANPITSPYTPAAVTGDASLQVMYTGNSSTSSHEVHASVGGTLLAQVMAKSGATDPQPDNVLSISMNGTGVSWSPSAVYGGGTNIPLTKG